MHYYREKGERLVCLLCSHYCTLKEHQIGICGVNKHENGEIKNLVYGYPSALHVDPIEKKPLYHFLPNSTSLSLGTVGCNFRCSFCQNHSLSQEHNIDTSHYYSPQKIVSLAKEHTCASIAYTYNEPTIFYPYAKDIAIEAKKEGIYSIYVTNGFESAEMIEDMVGVIDAFNVDLKCFDKLYYKKLGGTLQVVLDNLKRIHQLGLHVEITTLIVPTKNDSNEELENIASFIANELDSDIVWHISAFHPDYKELSLARTSSQTLKRAYEIGKKAGLNYVYIGNAGFENSTTCKVCGTTLITRNGFSVSSNVLDTNRCPNCKTVLQGVFT